MKPIEEYSCISKSPVQLFFWYGYYPAVKYTCSSSAIVTSAGLIFIDPLPLVAEAFTELLQEAVVSPAAIVLTNGNHQRGSVALAEKLSIPIYAPIGVTEEIFFNVEYQPGASFLGLHSIDLSGFGPGETALLDEEEQILIFGDAFINGDQEGLQRLPKKYCDDESTAKKSMLKLRKYSPRILVTAHGLPLVTKAKERLHAALDAFS